VLVEFGILRSADEVKEGNLALLYVRPTLSHKTLQVNFESCYIRIMPSWKVFFVNTLSDVKQGIF
jgi:hypothetical protein